MSGFQNRAEHSVEPFSHGEEHFMTVANFVLLKLRQMAGKLRTLVCCSKEWEVVSKKARAKQLEVLLKLCRCICPHFMAENVETERPLATPARSQSLPPKSQRTFQVAVPPQQGNASVPTFTFVIWLSNFLSISHFHACIVFPNFLAV